MRNDEHHLTLAAAAKLAPGRPSTCAVWRWCRVGIKARSGHRITLDHIRAGGRIFTTEANLQAFFDRVAEADREHFSDSPAPTSKPPTTKQRARSVQAAEAVLRAGGIV